MATKYKRDRPYYIPPRTRRDAAADWLENHESAGKLVLLVMLFFLPLIGMVWGIGDAWHAWLHEWREYDYNRKDQADDRSSSSRATN